MKRVRVPIPTGGYGILAHIPDGHFPEDDTVHLDGWYTDYQLARQIYARFRRRYPHALIHLVQAVEQDFRDGPQAGIAS